MKEQAWLCNGTLKKTGSSSLGNRMCNGNDIRATLFKRSKRQLGWMERIHSEGCNDGSTPVSLSGL